MYVCTEETHFHLKSWKGTLDTAIKFNASTREQEAGMVLHEAAMQNSLLVTGVVGRVLPGRRGVCIMPKRLHAPWLGSSLDGVIFDQIRQPPF